jgi:flagellar basal body-associated protein FliL
MKKFLIIITSILVVMFIALGVTLYVTLKPRHPVSSTPTNHNKNRVVYHMDKTFVTNLKDSDSYLKTHISIEVENKKDIEKLDKDIHRIRDRIIKILRDVTENDMKRIDIQDILKNEIKQDLQENLKIDTIIGIYFNELVVQ